MTKEYEYPIDVLLDKYEWLNVTFETPYGWDDVMMQMCEEVNDYLIANNLVDDYRVDQVKEKFGYLHWYDNGLIPRGLIEKYEKLTYHTCVICGEPATKLTTGWISPMCDECYKEHEKR